MSPLEILWRELCKKHPRFADPNNEVRLTSRGLKRMITIAYEEGEQAGYRRGKAKDPGINELLKSLMRGGKN